MPLTLVKCGGAALAVGPFTLERYVAPGTPVCVVHGGGGRITEAMRDAGIESEFVGGRRVTSDRALPIVRAALLEENRLLCAQIGERAVGLAGDELGLLADRVPELGSVGIPRAFAPLELSRLLAQGLVPVIAPLAVGPLNVNADDIAAALAVALGAERIVFVSDIPGVVLAGDVATQLSASDIDLLGSELEGGIVPKLQAAVRAARAGVRAEVGETLVVA